MLYFCMVCPTVCIDGTAYIVQLFNSFWTKQRNLNFLLEIYAQFYCLYELLK